MKTATATLEFGASGYAAAPGDRGAQALAGFRNTLRVWRERSKTRRALAELTPRMLDDVGIEPGDALDEAAKPFWRA